MGEPKQSVPLMKRTFSAPMRSRKKRAKQSAGTNTPATCPKCSGLLPYGMPAVTTARFGHVTGETLFCVVAIRLISPLEI